MASFFISRPRFLWLALATLCTGQVSDEGSGDDPTVVDDALSAAEDELPAERPEWDDLDDNWLLPTQKPVQVSTYEQGAQRAWHEVLDDDYASPSERVRTQCFTGSAGYQVGKTFCDLECLESSRNRGRVNDASGREGELLDATGCDGPWYCSKMEVCQLYHTKNTNDQEKGFHRGCMTIRSCANHSQCFPTVDDESRMNIQWFRDWDGDVRSLGSKIRDHGFKMFYGGMTYTTTCCVNRKNYRPGIDTPCNAATSAAAAPGRALAALALALGVALLADARSDPPL